MLAIEPQAVVLCIQQLLVAMFATYKPSLDRMQSTSMESLLNIDSIEETTTAAGIDEKLAVTVRLPYILHLSCFFVFLVSFLFHLFSSIIQSIFIATMLLQKKALCFFIVPA